MSSALPLTQSPVRSSHGFARTRSGHALRRLVKQVDPVDDRLQLTLIDQACQVLQVLPARLGEQRQGTLILTHQAQEWQKDRSPDQHIHAG